MGAFICLRCGDMHENWQSCNGAEDVTALIAERDALKAELEQMRRQIAVLRCPDQAELDALRARNAALVGLVGELADALLEELDLNPVGPERTQLIQRARNAINKEPNP